jgi:diguanylate cyclase (GGDEF)-like protein
MGSAGARQASWLFIVAGLIGMATDALPGTLSQTMLLAVGLDAAVVTVGVGARYLPWARWHPRAVLVLPTLALADLSVNISQGLLPDSLYGIWLVLVFVWIGQWQPPLTPIAMGPVAAGAYGVPFLFGTPVETTALGPIVLSVLVAVLVGETIARKERDTQAAQVGQREALNLLATASLTDDLTGLGNRRRANSLLDSLQEGDALAILDLDHFKKVNDSLGHLRGDQVLQDLGAYLKSAVRGGDDVARFGGEEFVVVLRAAGSSAVETVLRLLAGWRATDPITSLSAGLSLHRSGRASDITFAEADAALYDAKRDGRDRLVVHRSNPDARVAVAAAPLA